MRQVNDGLEAEMKTENKKATRKMWEVWGDQFISEIPWRMKTPIGILSFKRKRDADALFLEHYKNFTAGGSK